MKWLKKISHVITGLLATSVFSGCHQHTDAPTCIYGPPPSNKIATQPEADAVPAYPGDMDALQEANQAGADVPVAIYGPQPDDSAVPAYPGDMDALQEANQAGADVPVAIYGPQPDDSAVPAYPGDMDALQEANQAGADVPVAIYGPQPEADAVPAYPGPDADAVNKEEEVRREIGELRKADEPQIRALYGVRPPSLRQ